ncbi:hypothetical protein NLJ89_g5223 [Agrocybe chaxingu]|uniref:Uncharacterized protein n=1 Tax=Agrocybe chaxingu TaxID=84603 RepID=A0A9W8K1F1_9AGAR|nr:hypothetical protein NLJ89_g5223 [Agrocybe chaxingu]
MGSSHIHVVHKKHKRAAEAEANPQPVPVEKRALSDCATGSFYKSPEMGATVDSMQIVPVTWDPTCLPDKKAIDIYLYSPGSANSRIHFWSEIALSRGTYDLELKPRWWDATPSQLLQISIVPAGEPAFNSTFIGGPVFTATYTAPSDGSVPEAADTTLTESPITYVNDLSQKSGMNPGKTAAAVILPLLFVGLCIGAFIKMKRARGQERRKEWAEKIDKRMSTISTDWKSVSAAGANAAIRNSIAVGARNSSFSFGAIRPSSTIAVEGEDEKASMRQARTTTGVGLRNPASLTGTGERVSRVSFAPDTRVSRVSFADSRPSTESRRTRAYHSAYVPPVPALPDHKDDEKSDVSSDARDVLSKAGTRTSYS